MGRSNSSNSLPKGYVDSLRDSGDNFRDDVHELQEIRGILFLYVCSLRKDDFIKGFLITSALGKGQ